MNHAIAYYMMILRNKETPRPIFREAAHRVADLLVYEVAQFITMKSSTIQTPLASTEGLSYAGSIVLIPVLRSGMAMLPSFIHYFPEATVGVVGFRRDEKTAVAHRYYCNLPPIDAQAQIIITDPMLATGGTAIATIALLREQGVRDEQIIFVCMVSSPEGVVALQSFAPKLHFITAMQDEGLNSKKFIIPGLGDFGDRYFGTE
jgi:uracil phosphoribosyltransferase